MSIKYVCLFLSLVAAAAAWPLTASSTPAEKMVWELSEKSLRLLAVPGPAARKYADQIIALDLATFRGWPYLYEGTQELEEWYLENYFSSSQSLFLILLAGDKLAGYASLIPLDQEIDELKNPIASASLRCADYMYVGAIIIAEEYRHKGILGEIYKYAETHARAHGKMYALLTMIEREPNASLQPADYRPLDGMCRHFGFEKMKDVISTMEWTSSVTHEVERVRLGYWSKKIEG